MARTLVCRFERAWEEVISREGVREVRKMGSTRSRRLGEEKSVRFVNCRTSRRTTARSEDAGVVVELVSFEVVNVEDSERDIDRMCWLEELTLRRGIAGAIESEFELSWAKCLSRQCWLLTRYNL